MKKLLHVGCGADRINRTTPGFNDGSWKEVRLDINELNQPDVIGSMTDMSGVDSESIDAIFSSHNIEHLYIHEVSIALAEFMRVLKPDGFCVITCPDLQTVCELVAQDKLMDAAYQSPAGPITPLDILYGHSNSIQAGNTYMAHRCGFTQRSLSNSLKQSGYASVAALRRAKSFDLWAIASKNKRTEDEMRLLAKEHFPGK
jgi:ubiquinone/menaquinone biosynthesis C-methylase UbiE